MKLKLKKISKKKQKSNSLNFRSGINSRKKIFNGTIRSHVFLPVPCVASFFRDVGKTEVVKKYNSSRVCMLSNNRIIQLERRRHSNLADASRKCEWVGAVECAESVECARRRRGQESSRTMSKFPISKPHKSQLRTAVYSVTSRAYGVIVILKYTNQKIKSTAKHLRKASLRIQTLEICRWGPIQLFFYDYIWMTDDYVTNFLLGAFSSRCWKTTRRWNEVSELVKSSSFFFCFVEEPRFHITQNELLVSKRELNWMGWMKEDKNIWRVTFSN